MIKINWKGIREWSFLILAIGTFFIGSTALLFQIQTNATKKPDISLELYSTSSFRVSELSSISQNVEGDFYVRENDLNFKIVNLGQKNTEYMNFEIKDNRGEYEFKRSRIENLDKFENDFFLVDFWSKACKEAYVEAIANNKDFDFTWNKCRELGNNLTKDVIEATIRVDCPGCEFGKRYQCYSFEICVYGEKENLCEDYPDFQVLKETKCLEDW